MLRTVSGALAVLAMAFSWSAHAQNADTQDRAADRAAIEALMWRYVRALDTRDAEAYAQVFTEDGQFGTGPQAVKGREALAAMVEDFGEGRPDPAMYHVITNDHLEFVAEDRARYHSYWMTVFAAAEEDDTPRVAAVGRGVDELVRVDGEWLIASRDVAPQD